MFLTGHTGFKGAWLSLMLHALGAEVHAYALPPDTTPSLFADASIADLVHSTYGDVGDFDSLATAMDVAQPDVVLHLAAQAIVSASYLQPLATFRTNVLGTANLLEIARQLPSVRSVVVVTSDKCYENLETGRAYTESDALGGKDPYSASKACTEIVTASWRYSFFDKPGQAVVASARAGNVIGGGDWSSDRLIPDLVRAFMRGEPVVLRSPGAIRPWQHVLEPLTGYLVLAEACATSPEYAGAWNFGPDTDDARSVQFLVEGLAGHLGKGVGWKCLDENPVKEAKVLKLDSDKARTKLGWKPATDIETGLQRTADWYRRYLQGESALDLTTEQIRMHMGVGVKS